MKEDGEMISSMDSEFKNGPMAATTKDNITLEKDMAWELSRAMMEAFSTASSSQIISRVLVIANLLMARNMRDSGKKTRCGDKENSNGQAVELIKGNLRTILKTEKAS